MGKILKFKPNTNKPYQSCWLEKVAKVDLSESDVIAMALDCDEFVFSRKDESTDYYLKVNQDLNFNFSGEAIEQNIVDKSGGSFEEKIFLFNVKTSKSAFMNEVAGYLKRNSALRRVRDDLILCVDELFTNFQKSCINGSDIKMKIAEDENNIILSCEDSIGTLRPQTMLENIHRCFVKGVKGAIKKEGDGAGIGSYLMYKISVGLAIFVEEKKSTYIALWMPKMQFHEDRIELNKELFMCFKKGA